MKTSKKQKQPVEVSGGLPPNGLLAAGSWRVWLNLGFLFLTLGVAVFSIEQAKWIAPQPYFTLVLLGSIALTGLLTAIRLPRWIFHPAVILAGVLVTLWQGMMILPAGSGLNYLFSIVSRWLSGGAGLKDADGKIIFAVLLVVLSWAAGYLAAWALLRGKNAWVGVLLGLVILLFNLSNLPDNYFIYFIFFLAAAVLLFIQTNVIRQPAASGRQPRFSGKSLFYLAVTLCVIIVLAFSISWATPQLRLTGLQDAVAARMPWRSGLYESGFNIFNSVPSKQNVSTAAGLQSLSFGTFWNMGEDVKYTVVSPQPAYWQVNVYDEYTSSEWISNGGTEELLDKKAAIEQGQDPPGKTLVRYEVTPNLGTDVVLFTGEFISADMPVIVRRGVADEIIGARSLRVLSPGEKYSVKVYVADNSADTLSAASNNYSKEIKDTYLQLPAGFSPKVKALSDNLTKNAVTAYDKAIAIDTYLASIPYSREVDPLPEGVDAVEDFLFTQQKGFCIHFASAMAVMLRAEGVPARLAVGYLPGDPGKQQGIYLLRDKHYHAWTQVYFPGYGWIDFEPTPAGTAGSEVAIEAPLVSVPEIEDLPDWNYWYYPQINPNVSHGNAPPPSAPANQIYRSDWAFSRPLGVAVAVIGGIAAVLGLLYGLYWVIRPFYKRQLWNVDRDNPAASAYVSLQRLAAMNNLVHVPQQTPQEFVAQIAAIIPEQSQNLDLLLRAYQGRRFGPDKGKPGLYEEAEILKARVLVYGAMLQKRGRLYRFLWQS